MRGLPSCQGERTIVPQPSLGSVDSSATRRHARVHNLIGGVTCLMLEPGARISHAAVGLAARTGALVVWIGEAGVGLYAAGRPAERGRTSCSGRPRWPRTPLPACAWYAK